MTEKLKLLGFAAVLIAGPAIATLAATTDTTATPGTTSTYQAPGTMHGSTTMKGEQAANSVDQSQDWKANHPHKAAVGSTPTQSGMAGGGGQGH